MNARAIVCAVAALAAAGPAAAQARRSAFALAPGPVFTLSGNRVQCLLVNDGEICGDEGWAEGGFWPAHSPNNHLFRGGLQLAAIIPESADLAWAGDTVGAFFADVRGDQHHGEGLTGVYSSDGIPASQWPAAARLLDTALFDARLLGRDAASQQDSWLRYWDGNSSLMSGRHHPMGLLIEQRTMAWNYPVGNEDIVYEIFRIVNITASDPARYAGLADAGYGPDEIAQFVRMGQMFQGRMRVDLGVEVPDGGYTFDQLYAGYVQDQDVGDAGHNFVTASFPFNLMAAYKSDFVERHWQYPVEIFATPLAQAPSFVGHALLKSPGNGGLRFFSATTNTSPGYAFPDPQGTTALWEALSFGAVPPGVACNVPGGNPAAVGRRTCYIPLSSTDTRSYESVGPLTLRPGQSAVLVMALVFAAPVRAPIAARIGSDIPPGWPVDGARLAQGLDTVGTIDSAMGWRSHMDADGDGVIEWNEVVTVPRSLLWKTQLAQAVVNAKFVMPSPPERPAFFLVPGDGQVQVVWQKSVSETTGDPFFPVAADPTTPLYDPDYRKYDVQGYRIWRGLSPSSMQVVAQFDYAGARFIDYTGQVLDRGVYGNRCAPELGITATCPAFPFAADLYGLVQVRPGDRILLPDSGIAVLHADTAVTGHASGYPSPCGSGVPFVYADTAVRNGVSYFYAVTAFDVNSINSGPSSLQSDMQPRTVTPRAASAGIQGGASFVLNGRDATPLDPSRPMPAIDPATGNFTGPMPPTDGITMAFASYLPFVPSGRISLHIDSIKASNQQIFVTGNDSPGTYYTTATTPAGTVRTQLAFVMSATSGDATQQLVYEFPPLNMSNGLANRFGGDSSAVLYSSATLDFTAGNWLLAGVGRGAANAFPYGNSDPYNGPVMWTGSAPPANPNGNNGPISSVLNKGLSIGVLNGGTVAGVSRLWHISGYLTAGRPSRGLDPILSSVFRAADFAIYWGATAGRIDSVIDVTHNVVVPFNRNVSATWGVLNDSSFTNTPLASIPDTSTNTMTWTDAFCVYPITIYQQLAAASCGGLGEAQSAFLMDHAIANPINYYSSNGTDASAAPAGQPLAAAGRTGTGFLLYLAGGFWVVQLQSNLAACCQNTVWHARYIAGAITGSPGSFGYTMVGTRPPAVPGLTASLVYTSTDFDVAASNDTLLDRVHTVPDPYYLTTSLEALTGQQLLRWVNVPPRAIIRVYTASGILVALLTHNDPTGGGEVPWNLTSRIGDLVASGVYFWELTTADGKHRVGRFTIVTGER